MCPAARCCRLFCLCVSLSLLSPPPLRCMRVCAPHRREQHDIGCAAGAAPHNGDLQQHYALCACVQHQHKGAAGTNHSVMPLHWMERGVLQVYICTIGEGCAARVHMYNWRGVCCKCTYVCTCCCSSDNHHHHHHHDLPSLCLHPASGTWGGARSGCSSTCAPHLAVYAPPKTRRL
jgi:hypothetical protein